MNGKLEMNTTYRIAEVKECFQDWILDKKGITFVPDDTLCQITRETEKAVLLVYAHGFCSKKSEWLPKSAMVDPAVGKVYNLDKMSHAAKERLALKMAVRAMGFGA